jgi:hypothetical protein
MRDAKAHGLTFIGVGLKSQSNGLRRSLDYLTTNVTDAVA